MQEPADMPPAGIQMAISENLYIVCSESHPQSHVNIWALQHFGSAGQPRTGKG